jgi:hypothetical protein
MHATCRSKSRLVLTTSILLHRFAARRGQQWSCGARSSRHLTSAPSRGELRAGYPPEDGMRAMEDDGAVDTKARAV